MRATAAPQLLANHTCRTAQEVGWKSVKNGELLTLAEAQFDLFITSDHGLAYQENLRGRRIAILELSTDKLRPIEAAAAQLQDAVEKISHAEFRRLEIPYWRMSLASARVSSRACGSDCATRAASFFKIVHGRDQGDRRGFPGFRKQK